MGGGFGFSESESEPVDMTPREYKGMRGPVSNELMNWIMGGGPSYGGPFVAPMTSREGLNLDQLQSWSGGSGLEGQARDYLGRTMAGDYLRPESNPFLQAYIKAAQRPAVQAYEDARLADKILFTGAGQSIQRGSPYAAARARSDEGLANMLSDISTGIAYPAYGAERAIMAAAPAESREMDAFRFERGMKNLEAQALPRLIEQYGIDAGIKEFNRRIEMLMAALGLAGGLGQAHLGQESSSFSFSTAGGMMGGGGGDEGGSATK